MLKKLFAFALVICLCSALFSLYPHAAENDLSFAENEFVKCAENDNFALYAIGEGVRKGEFYIENKQDGGRFFSNPQARDFSDEGLSSAEKESSQLLLQLYSAESGAIRTLNSFSGTAKGKYLTIKPQKNGFDSAYKINNAIKITLKIRLCDFGFTVESDLSKVNFSEDNIILSVDPLPYFFCCGFGQEGYSLVPDGCGALIYNNTEKTTASPYSQKLYGTDLAFSSSIHTVDTKPAAMPVFGAKNAEGGFLAVIDKGSANAEISAVSAYNESMLNRVYCSFDLVGSDKISLGNGGSAYTSAAETYKYDCPLTEKIKLSYMLVPKTAGYSEMAALYREHLGLRQGSVNAVPSLFLELYGGFTRKESVCGIPVTVFKKLTTADEAQKIVSFFADEINGSPVVSFRQVDPAVISGKIQNKFKIKSALGSRADFAELKSLSGGVLYFENDLFSAEKSGNGFFKFTGTASRINHNSVTLDNFNLATTGIDTTVKSSYALKVPTLQKIYKKYFKSVSNSGYESAFINLANSAYSDFTSRGYISREECIDAFCDILSNYGENGLIYSPNAYAFSFGKYFADLPTSSSEFDIIDADVPFYQMVLSGVKEFSGESVNLSANIEDAFLKALECGSSLKYTFIYNNITAIKNTNFEYLFGADFESRKSEALDLQKRLEECFEQLGSRVIKRHEILDCGASVTEFENGSRVIINYSDSAVDTPFGRVQPRGYIIAK